MARPSDALVNAIEAALDYARRDWPVFPVYEISADRLCACGAALECRHPGKHPSSANGYLAATTDRTQIVRWWSERPRANIGRGLREHELVLDVDVRNGGDATFADLELCYAPLPETPSVLTGGGGSHDYLILPVGFRALCGPLGGEYPGIDIKSLGGYVLMPPSNHVTGGTYTWAAGAHPDDVPVAAAPDWLLSLIANRGRARRGGGGSPVSVGEGQRNVTLAGIAGSLRRRGACDSVIEIALLEFNARQCDPPLDQREVRAIARSISRYAPAPGGFSRFSSFSAGRDARSSEAEDALILRELRS